MAKPFEPGNDPRRNTKGAPRGPRKGISVTEFHKKLLKGSTDAVDHLLERLRSDKTSVSDKDKIALKITEFVLKVAANEGSGKSKGNEGKQPESKPATGNTKGNVTPFSNRPITKSK